MSVHATWEGVLFTDEFIVPLDDPNEEITEQWQDGLHVWCTCRDGQCSIKSATPIPDCLTESSASIRISSVTSQRRSISNVCSCLRRRLVTVSVRTKSQTSQPCECDSRCLKGPCCRAPQEPSVVAWFQRCLRVSQCISPVWTPVTAQQGTQRT